MNINAIRTDAHVVPSHGLWAVKVEGSALYSGHWYTKLEATAFAMDVARNSHSSVILHGLDGRFQTVWSYDAFRGMEELTTKDTI